MIGSDKKGEIAKAIDASHCIDDRYQNANMVHYLSEKYKGGRRTKSYLIDRPYNQAPGLDPRGIIRIKTFTESLNDIEGTHETYPYHTQRTGTC